jgi:ferredoxin-NADP reductase
VLLQVSLPRQPCFKLNHRFRIKNFAPLTWKTSRTGWYFRVLRPGFIQAGDIIRLVQRPHPQWTIERVQEYLHRNTGDASANEELAAIPEFGAECADTFRARVVRQQARERRLQREKEAGTPKKREGWKDYRIVEKTKETPRVISLTLEAVDQSVLLANDNNNNNDEEPELRPGSHARLKLPNGLVRAYSIVSGSQDGSRLQLGVGLADPSRGGSAYLHRTAKVGDILALGAITPPPAGSRQLAKAASHHVFLAAGIGITAFLPLLEYYRDIHYSTELHYAVRSEAWDVPFRERLAALTEPPAGSSTTTTTTTTTTTMAATQNCGNGTRTPAPLTTTGASSVSVTIYDASAGKRLNVAHILSNFPWNARLYVCGPRRLMEEASREARARGIPQRDVHFEAFDADVVLDGLDGENKREPFEAIVANRGGRVVKVGRDESLLESLKRELGEDEVGSSCEVGNCGTCRVGLKSGQVEHRGTALLEEEKATAMLACVSRGVGCITIEI